MDQDARVIMEQAERARRELEETERRAADEFRLRLMRLHAVGCDDGKGWCRHCGAQMIECGDGLGHPWPLCEVPQKCPNCGDLIARQSGERDQHTCTARSVVKVYAPAPKLKVIRRTADSWYDKD